MHIYTYIYFIYVYTHTHTYTYIYIQQEEGSFHRGADKSLARSGRKQATAKEDFNVHISYL